MALENTSALENLEQIKVIMNRSRKFTYLNGYVGVAAGVLAALSIYFGEVLVKHVGTPPGGLTIAEVILWYKYPVLLAIVLFGTCGLLGVATSYLAAKKEGRNAFSFTGRRMAFNFGLPIFIGGLFCIVELPYARFLIPATMMVFYGLGCINGSHYASRSFYPLGIVMCALGLFAGVTNYNREAMLLGFGLAHIVFGLYMRWEGRRK